MRKYLQNFLISYGCFKKVDLCSELILKCTCRPRLYILHKKKDRSSHTLCHCDSHFLFFTTVFTSFTVFFLFCFSPFNKVLSTFAACLFAPLRFIFEGMFDRRERGKKSKEHRCHFYYIRIIPL